MSGSVRIRPAGVSDASSGLPEALAAAEAECFSDPWSARMISDALANPLDIWLIAEEETEDGGVTFIGYADLRVMAPEAELLRIAVLPAFRGRGISRMLLEEGLRKAAERGAEDVTLEVRSGNAPALGLYASFGFRTEAVRKDYYRDPAEDALICWKRGMNA